MYHYFMYCQLAFTNLRSFEFCGKELKTQALCIRKNFKEAVPLDMLVCQKNFV